MTTPEKTPTAILAEYMARARTADLPDAVAERGKHHILDTLAAMVSGTTLPVGRMATKYVGLQGGGNDATVAGLKNLQNGVFAALANGMLAHADETDDSHAAAGMHPGCAIIPAALAMAEKNRRFGLVVPDASRSGGDDVDVEPVLAALRGCHSPPVVERVDPGSGAALSQAMLRLKLDGVTTVLPYLSAKTVAGLVMPASEPSRVRVSERSARLSLS